MAKKTIKLKKYVDIVNEYDAGGAITPGMLVTLASDGDVDKNGAAGVACEKMFALEDELQGKTIDDAYATGAPVQCWTAVPGEEVLAWLKDGEDVAVGDVLTSAGAGKLKAKGITDIAIAVALEAVDMSGSAGADPSGRIAVRIL